MDDHFRNVLAAPDRSEYKRCLDCGGFGKGLVKDHGYCDHCFRLRETGSSTGSAKRKLDSLGSPSIKRGRIDNDDDSMDEAAIARLLEAADAADVDTLDLPALKQAVISLEKKIKKNQMLRMKYSDQPKKFMESEMALDEAIHSLHALSTSPELYPEFVALGGVSAILGLLSHENTDISLDIVALLTELTDPQTFAESGVATALLDAVIAGGGLQLLVQNLSRLDESSTEDAQGVYNTLNVLENVTEIRGQSVCDILGGETQILAFLLKRLKVRIFDGNKLYASELLSVLLQQSQQNQRRIGTLEGVDGVDLLLQIVSYYRRRNPGDAEEEECCENMFNSLATCLMISENQTRFRHSEGFELMLRTVKEKCYARRCALKVLNFAVDKSSSNARRFVDTGGLKTIFPLFMGRGLGRVGKAKGRKGSRSLGLAAAAEDEENVIGIVYSLSDLLSGIHMARFLRKFLEADCAKVERLVELHSKYYAQLQAIDNEDEDILDAEDEALAADMKFLRHLDAAVPVQRVDSVMARLCSLDQAIRTRIFAKLYEQDIPLSQILGVLTDYRLSLGDAETKPAIEQPVQDESKSSAEGSSTNNVEKQIVEQRAKLARLIDALNSSSPIEEHSEDQGQLGNVQFSAEKK